MYVSLISELMWHVDYNNSQSTIENYDLIKRKNIGFIDAFENLLQEVNDLSPIELRRRCSKILSDYKASFESEKLRNRKMFKNSARYNIRIK
jgi:ABC-type lipoprotein export system ATPase subunit